MKIAGSLLVLGLCPVSAITQESNENPIAFLESLKEALQIAIASESGLSA